MRNNLSSNIPKALACLACLFSISSIVEEVQAEKRTWSEEKCVRYSDAWDKAVTLYDKGKMTAAFVAEHERFIKAECDHEIRVCPVSDYDLEVANAMVVASMNAGTASTFPPFTCRDENKELPNYKGK